MSSIFIFNVQIILGSTDTVSTLENIVGESLAKNGKIFLRVRFEKSNNFDNFQLLLLFDLHRK